MEDTTQISFMEIDGKIVFFNEAEAVSDPEVNTYILEYVPEVRFGVKITGGNLMDKPIYIGGDPIPHQIHGDSSLYDYVIPVSGFIGASLADRIQPFH